MLQKKNVKFLISFSLIYFLPFVLFSDDIKDAEKYYKSLDYKYALEIYEKIMKANPKMEIAERIANCYRFINNTEAAEIWYKKTLTYVDAPVENYRYLADALKQNGKFEEAANNYKTWGELKKEKAKEAEVLANACLTAKLWTENPDIGSLVENEITFNSENSDFCPVTFGDNMLIVSDRWPAKNKPNTNHDKKNVYGWTGNPFLKIYNFNKATNQTAYLDNMINSGYHNGPMVLNATLDTLIFTRSFMPSKALRKNNQPGRKYLMLAVKKADKWAVIETLPFNAEGKFSVQHPALSPDGQILYFASDMPGGYGGVDIYFSEKQKNGSWSKPVNCGDKINTIEDDVFPSVRNDGKFFYSTKGNIGMGGLDIFSAIGERNNFTAIENLRSPMNSPKDDFGIVFITDKTGYLSSNRNGGVGLDDIYRFKTGIKAEPKSKEKIFAVNGSVVEKGTNSPIQGMEIILFNKDSGQEVKTTTNTEGKFEFTLAPETNYAVKGKTELFFTTQEGNISTKDLQESTIFNVRFELEKSKDAFTIRLNNIYYDFNKWNIRQDAVSDLNKVNQFMKSMPNIKIEMVAHTDARGKAAYNLELSNKRAESAKNYLIEAGISTERLSAVGKGETELLNQCSDGVKCTAAQHQFNRRTEFKIIKFNPVASIFKPNHLLAKK